MKERIAEISKEEGYPTSRLPPLSQEEIQLIRGSYDFFGLNHYTTGLIYKLEQPKTAPTSFKKDLGTETYRDPKWKKSKAPWLYDVPWGFRKLLNWINYEYGNIEVAVTENGYCDDGQVEDKDRVSYHKVMEIHILTFLLI